MPEIFAIPILEKVLIFAPLHDLAALVDPSAAEQIRRGLAGQPLQTSPQVAALVADLSAPPAWEPQPRTGPLRDPFFLGLVTTRNCNMACRYCDFAAPKSAGAVMDVGLARRALDAYLDLLHAQDLPHAEVHFFGGEPFCAPDAVCFAVEYAASQAAVRNLSTHFEVITNGLFNPRLCQWVADRFDTVVLSLDGPADIQDRYRPGLNGALVFKTVARNTRFLSDSGVELILRACISAQTAGRMPEIAAWMTAEFKPAAVCFETLVPSPASRSAGLEAPDPWTFAWNFHLAAEILARKGIQAILSTASLCSPQVSFCPVGKDALILTSDGALNACYLLPEDWRREGLDLKFGRLRVGGAGRARFEIDQPALEAVRRLNVTHYPLCADCFCRYQCAGGCHVRRRGLLYQRQPDSTCLQTQLVTARNLLVRLGNPDLAGRWLADLADRRAPALLAHNRLIP